MTGPAINYEARLVPFADGSEHAAVLPGSWFITHGLGGPAAGTYTEVAFATDSSDQLIREEAVRKVAVALYGNTWAFTYRPEKYEDAIARHGLRRRERVVVTSVEVWT